jgi:hypothetical protein
LPSVPPALPQGITSAAAQGSGREVKPSSPGLQAGPSVSSVPGYGIERAVEMMRKLPDENVELVVDVVKIALESAHIEVSGIIDDAIRRETDIQGRVDVLRSEITDLEQQIATRCREIDALESTRRETAKVKERLTLAQERAKRPVPSTAAPDSVPELEPAAETTEESQSPADL